MIRIRNWRVAFLFLILCGLAESCFAGCPLLTHDDNPDNEREFQNICQQIANPTTGTTSGTSATYSTVTVNSNLIVSKINGSSFSNFQASTQCINTTTFSTANGAYQSTYLTCKITPSSIASRVRITAVGAAATNGAGTPIISLFRDSSDLDLSTNGFIQPTGLSASAVMQASAIYIDAPASASQITYSVKLKSSNGASTVSWGAGAMQVMILEEIK